LGEQLAMKRGAMQILHQGLRLQSTALTGFALLHRTSLMLEPSLVFEGVCGLFRR
jgi:hypothetical protein